eukprot:5976180-Pleurochrysis_carterae.AAC.2
MQRRALALAPVHDCAEPRLPRAAAVVQSRAEQSKGGAQGRAVCTLRCPRPHSRALQSNALIHFTLDRLIQSRRVSRARGSTAGMPGQATESSQSCREQSGCREQCRVRSGLRGRWGISCVTCQAALRGSFCVAAKRCTTQFWTV